MVTPEQARAFLSENHQAVLSTFRSDGRPQLSPVTVGVDGEGRVIISTVEATAKYRNLRRDPRVSVCVLNREFFGPWVAVEGSAEIVQRPDAIELLVDYYRRVAGEHPDWADYRRAMEEQRRVLVRFAIERCSGVLPG